MDFAQSCWWVKKSLITFWKNIYLSGNDRKEKGKKLNRKSNVKLTFHKNYRWKTKIWH